MPPYRGYGTSGLLNPGAGFGLDLGLPTYRPRPTDYLRPEDFAPPAPPAPPQDANSIYRMALDGITAGYHAFENAPSIAANYYAPGGEQALSEGLTPQLPTIRDLIQSGGQTPDQIADDSYGEAITRKLTGFGAEMATSPTNAAILLGTGGASGLAGGVGRGVAPTIISDLGTAAAAGSKAAQLAQRGISLGFGASMLPGVAEGIAHTAEGYGREGLTPNVVAEGVGTGLEGLMAAFAIKHGLAPHPKPAAPATAEVPLAETAPVREGPLPEGLAVDPARPGVNLAELDRLIAERKAQLAGGQEPQPFTAPEAPYEVYPFDAPPAPEFRPEPPPVDILAERDFLRPDMGAMADAEQARLAREFLTRPQPEVRPIEPSGFAPEAEPFVERPTGERFTAPEGLPVPDAMLEQSILESLAPEGPPRLGSSLPKMTGPGAEDVSFSPRAAEAAAGEGVRVTPRDEAPRSVAAKDAVEVERLGQTITSVPDAELRQRESFYRRTKYRQSLAAVKDEISRRQQETAATPEAEAARPKTAKDELTPAEMAEVNWAVGPGNAARVNAMSPAEARAIIEPMRRAKAMKAAREAAAAQPTVEAPPVEAPPPPPPTPSPAQAAAGNYKKGHVKFQGLDLSIETPKGAERVAKDGSWRTPEMPADYGYIKRSEAADGEHLDIFKGDHPDADTVFVIDQGDIRTGKYDEAKAMLGFADEASARAAYEGSFSDGKGAERIQAITPMSVAQFKAWVHNGDTTRPAAEMVRGASPAVEDGKAETVSPESGKIPPVEERVEADVPVVEPTFATDKADSAEFRDVLLSKAEQVFSGDERKGILERVSEDERGSETWVAHRDGAGKITATAHLDHGVLADWAGSGPTAGAVVRRLARANPDFVIPFDFLSGDSARAIDAAMKRGGPVGKLLREKYADFLEERGILAAEESASGREGNLVSGPDVGAGTGERAAGEGAPVEAPPAAARAESRAAERRPAEPPAELAAEPSPPAVEKAPAEAAAAATPPTTPDALRTAADAARARLIERGKGHQANDLGSAAAQGAGTTVDLGIIGADYIARGFRTFGTWGREMLKALGDVVPGLAAQLRKVWTNARGVWKGANPKNTSGPQTTTVQGKTGAGTIVTTPRGPAATPPPTTAGAPGTGFTLPEATLVDRASSYFQDRLRRLEVVEGAVQAQGGKAGAKGENVKAAADALGAKVAAQHERIRHEYVDPLAKVMGERKTPLADLDDYMAILHAPDRDAVIAKRTDGKITEGSGWTAQERTSRWKELEQKYGAAKSGRIDLLEPAADLVRNMRDEQIRVLLDGGLVSKAQVASWKREMGDHYVPFRTAEAQEGIGTGQGFDIRGKESKAATGRGTKADSPVTFMLQQLYRATVRAEKNKVDQRFAEFVKDNNLFEMDKTHERTELDAKGKVKTVPDALRAQKDFTYKVDGETHRIDIDSVDPLLDRAMKNLSSQDRNIVVDNLGAMTRRFSQLVTSRNPSFILPNFVRDVQQAVTSIGVEHGKDVAKDALTGLVPALKEMFQASRDPAKASQMVRDFKEDGGAVGWYQVKNIAELEKDLTSRISDVNAGNARKLWTKMWDGIDDVNHSIENATRYATYSALRKAGASRSKAAHAARNVTVDFTKKGEAGPTINALYAFFNAGVQGAKRMKEVLVDTPKGRALAASLVATGMTMDAYNRAMAGDGNKDGTNDYDAIPEYVKARNWVVMRGEGKKPLLIPLPHGLNVLHTTGRQIMGALQGATTPGKAATNVVGAAANALNPLGGEADLVQALSPTFLDPFVQHATNKTWSGRPLKPEQFPGAAKKPDSEMFFKSAPPAAIAIARWLNDHTGGDKVTPGYISVSPEVLSLYADTANSYLTGGLGKDLLKAGETAKSLASGEAPALRNLPVVNRFAYEESPGAEGQQFRANLEELDTLWSRYNSYRKEGNASAVKALPVELLKVKRRVAPIEAQINTIRKALKTHPDKEARGQELIAALQTKANRMIAEARQASGLPSSPQ